MDKSVKHGRFTTSRNVTASFTMFEMFVRFKWFKQSGGLAFHTIEEYQNHYQLLLDYLAQDKSKESK
ncbi:hypothetical protein KW850_23945 [Bacillus sp. sid0103]|uniref:hypothetical protein n=1 Tax=Bacillus sp. sid0103 TaxID=2856337 RepID=UPI001C45782F|nr:hypothetical protein [Bacillus sp. sid0103]MBV7508276.1 hypothetical protein [Bacillus sp. sid0103]